MSYDTGYSYIISGYYTYEFQKIVLCAVLHTWYQLWLLVQRCHFCVRGINFMDNPDRHNIAVTFDHECTALVIFVNFFMCFFMCFCGVTAGNRNSISFNLPFMSTNRETGLNALTV